MALPIRTQIKVWSFVAIVAGVVLWFLGNQLLPFVLGAAVAYFLDPVADRLERLGLSRVAAVALISVFAVSLFIVLLLLVLPALINQLISLVNALPDYVQGLRNILREEFPGQMRDGSTLQQSLASVAETLRSKGGDLLNTALSSALSVVNVMILVVIVPVVSFYLLVDWDRMIERIDQLLPRDHAPTIRKLARDMDATLAGFIRGQGTVCLILGTFYAIGLMFAGLNFGLLIGALAGLISFIPYVGSIVGGTLAIGVAVVQFWSAPEMIAVVAGIFLAGQLVEGNFLTPKLVGNSVGLHPVWLLLALSVFGALFGFVGMLVAVPVSAMIGVLVRFLIGQYLSGRLYLGLEALHAAEEAQVRDAPPIKRPIPPRTASPAHDRGYRATGARSRLGRPRLTRDSFFEGPCNSAALSEVLTTDFWDGLPRVLSGPAGAGKTHLAHIFAAETGALRLTPARLAADSVPRAADAPAVVLDNAQQLSHGRIFEEIGFHLFNQARQLGQPLLIAGRGPVRDWGLTLPDLSSRLTASAQIRVTNPDEDMLRMVLIKLFADRQLAVPAEAIEYTIHRMERSFSAARALVAALDDANLRENRRITKPMIRETITRLSQGKTLQGGPE